MTSRERVQKTIRFETPDRLPYHLPEKHGSDIAWMSMEPHPDARLCSGIDEWGCVWENVGVSNLGEVTLFPLQDWDDLDKLKIPEISSDARWLAIEAQRREAGDRFIIARGVSIYERIHFIRGLQDTWMDIIEEPEELCKLIDILVEMNLYAIERYAAAGANGYMWWDDWGLQDSLMISPKNWREIWKPRYARIYKAAHEAGLYTFLHSCGDITSILNDLIEVGLDVIQMDQQQNMGLERLGREFGGRITFWCPVDIQNRMVQGSAKEIESYCGDLVKFLSRPEGGFMAKWYDDPEGAGHTPEAIEAMAQGFKAACSLHTPD